MKIRSFYLLLALTVLAGCSKDGSGDNASSDPRVLLGVNSLKPAGTRAVIDVWDQTEVGIAYRTSSPLYTEYLNITIDQEADQIIDTGMEYPDDASTLHAVGYYPALAPQATGLVTYDISKGDIDLMCSNEVSGDKNNTILDSGDKMQFKHLLTRLTFTLQCSPGQSYPERIAGILIGGVKTYASLNLATGTPYFTIPGTVYTGHPDGYYIPASYENKLVLDAMIQPGAGISVDIITVNDNIKPVTFTTLNTLQTSGGAAGKQYVVNLVFNGTAILADKVSIVDWTAGANMPNQPNGSNPWW